MHGARYTNLVIDECDLLIAIGARFDDRATGNPERVRAARSDHSHRHRRARVRQDQARRRWRSAPTRRPRRARAAEAHRASASARRGCARIAQLQAALIRCKHRASTICARRTASCRRSARLLPTTASSRPTSASIRCGSRKRFPFARPRSLAHVRRARHDGLRLARRDRRGAGGARRDDDLLHRRRQPADEHAGAGDARRARSEREDRSCSTTPRSAWCGSSRNCSISGASSPRCIRSRVDFVAIAQAFGIPAFDLGECRTNRTRRYRERAAPSRTDVDSRADRRDSTRAADGGAGSGEHRGAGSPCAVGSLALLEVRDSSMQFSEILSSIRGPDENLLVTVSDDWLQGRAHVRWPGCGGRQRSHAQVRASRSSAALVANDVRGTGGPWRLETSRPRASSRKSRNARLNAKSWKAIRWSPCKPACMAPIENRRCW